MTAPAPDDLVAALAATLLAPDVAAFEAQARAGAAALAAPNLARLRPLLHHPPPVPPTVPPGRLGLGTWLAGCQAAVFELLYHLAPASLPLVRQVAFGPYDWPQANALEVLCRLAVAGALPATTLADINAQFGTLRYETHLYLAEDLTARAARDPRFAAVLTQLSDPDFQEALAEVRAG